MFKSVKYTLGCSKALQERFHNCAILSQEIKAQTIIEGNWEEKIKIWQRKYEDLFGITELSEMQKKVLEEQKSMEIIREKRRKVQEDIFVTQKKLQETHEILHRLSMGDNMYISVVTQVQELLKDQKNLKETFFMYDQTEREQQTTLELAINNNHVHERNYREKNKYLSLITGVIGGLLGLLGSSVNNWRHRKEIKVIASGINDLKKNDDKLLAEIKVQQESFQENNKVSQPLLHNISPDQEAYNEFYADLQLKNISNQLEEKLNYKLSHHTSLNIGLIGSLIVFSTLVLYFTNSH